MHIYNKNGRDKSANRRGRKTFSYFRKSRNAFEEDLYTNEIKTQFLTERHFCLVGLVSYLQYIDL